MEYEPKRTTSKFCSDKCRKEAFKGLSVPVSVPKDSVPLEVSVPSDDKKVSVPNKFINHITSEEHEITEISKRTGLNYDLEETSEKLGIKKKRCSGCGEPTWFGCYLCKESQKTNGLELAS